MMAGIRSVGLRVLVVMVFLSPVVAGTFRVWVHQQSVQSGYALSVAERERRLLRVSLREAKVEWAALTAPDRLRAMASRFGMGPVTPKRVWRLDLEVMGPPAPRAAASGARAR